MKSQAVIQALQASQALQAWLSVRESDDDVHNERKSGNF